MADTATPPGNLKDKQELSSMGFLEHLEELRKRIIWSIVSIGDWVLRLLLLARSDLRLDTEADRPGPSATTI